MGFLHEIDDERVLKKQDGERDRERWDWGNAVSLCALQLLVVPCF